MKKLFLLLFLFSFLSGCACEKGIVLTSNPGEYDIKQVGQAQPVSMFLVKFKLTKALSHERWPASAYAGFFDGTFDNMFQFMVQEDIKDSTKVLVGYRLVKNGQVKRVDLHRWNRSDEIQALFSFGVGGVSVTFLGEKEELEPIEVTTNMNVAAPFIQVSSGNASFQVDLIDL